MSPTAWSALLQYSRAGTNAAVFLLAARVLPLAELGAFAAAFAPVRLLQGPLRAAVTDAAVILPPRPGPLTALALLAGAAALLAALVLWAGAALMPGAAAPTLRALALLPPIWALGAVSEGWLRRRMRLRALALRGLAAQTLAAAAAAVLLWQGAGHWALVGFAFVNAAIASLSALFLAGLRPARPEGWAAARAAAWRLGLREAVAGVPIPLAQIGIGLTLGLGPAGAFQIATRALQLADALALAPLRYVALPRLAATPGRLGAELHRAVAVGGWVSALILAAAPEALALLVGAEAAAAALPPLLLMAPMPLVAALTMPLRQALAARGETGAVLSLALLTLGASLLLLPFGLALSAPATAAGLSLAAMLASLAWLGRPAPRSLGARPLAAAWRPAAAALTAALALRPLAAAVEVPAPVAAPLLVLAATALYAALMRSGLGRAVPA